MKKELMVSIFQDKNIQLIGITSVALVVGFVIFISIVSPSFIQ